MRIARVLRQGADETSPFPTLALERDGALYDVGELDALFDTPHHPDRLAGASDFHTRVLALGCAGLDQLDARLRAGERPTEARLLPGTFLWLPPCDPERAYHVQLAAYDAEGPRPAFQLCNARGLIGHDEAVVFPEDEERPDFELGVAAVIGEDLRCATEEEAEGAILGYAILNAWRGRDDEERQPPAMRRVAAQLGPVLVTTDELGDVGRLRAQARVGGRVVADTNVGGWTFPPAASIAWVSRWMDLRAGDVIGIGCVRGGTGAACGAAPRFGEGVELLVERMGKLGGRAVRG
jgi:2-keto-4-pentenoate hydratase/2-oxohepta-3-ene-1,7-dioic acid hydratase in catechol pathway